MEDGPVSVRSSNNRVPPRGLHDFSKNLSPSFFVPNLLRCSGSHQRVRSLAKLPKLSRVPDQEACIVSELKKKTPLSFCLFLTYPIGDDPQRHCFHLDEQAGLQRIGN